jgi:hypothetical protein
VTRLAKMAMAIAPPRLRGPVGRKLIYALTAPLDALVEFAFQGIKARFPLVGTPTALPAIARDRVLRPGPNESAQAFAARSVRWLDDHRVSGSPWALLDQLAAYFGPTPPLLRFVQSNATSTTWYTRAPDGTRTKIVVRPVPNFDWDGAGNSKRARGFVIVYCVGGVPFDTGGNWSDGSRVWGDGGTWGTSARPADVAGVLALLADWTAAHALSSWMIFAFDPTSFDPAAAPGAAGMPDGTWGQWHKVVAGVAVAARLGTARYWEVS